MQVRNAAAMERRRGVAVSARAAFWAAVGLFAVAAAGFGVTTHGVVTGNRIATSDPRHLDWFSSHPTGVMDAGARVATALGSANVLLVLAVLAAIALWLLGVRLAVAVAPLASLVAAGTVTMLVKDSVTRWSPLGTGRWRYATLRSFPSGHAADSAAFFVALSMIVAVAAVRRPLYRLGVVAVGFAIPAAIGVSRLVLRRHWPSDVVAGWGLGSAVAILAVLLAMGARLASHPGGGVEELRELALRRSSWSADPPAASPL